MLKLFGARKLTWNGLVCDEKGGVSPRQDCVYNRHSIGKGARGVVHRGKYCIHYSRHADITLDVAVKETHVRDAELESLIELKDEEEIIHLYNYSETGVFRKYLFVIELCKGGDLLEYVLARPLSAADSARVIHWLVRAVHKCHLHGIIHTDIKLENIGLLRKNSIEELRLLDFGNSRKMSDAPFTSKQLRGSPHYIAPELKHKATFSGTAELCAVDMWCVGIVTYALLENEFYVGSVVKFCKCTDPFMQRLVRNLLCPSHARWSASCCVDYFDTAIK